MTAVPSSLALHRVRAAAPECVGAGQVRYAPLKSLWFTGMAFGAVVGGVATFSWAAFALFLAATAVVLLFGHSLGSHRKFIHSSYDCPKWLEYTLVYCGVQVGLAGPLGLLRQHELRDYAQRLPQCHDYLRHGRAWWQDAWWQLHCDLVLTQPPLIRLEPRIADDAFYRFLERTWMAQQLPWALLFHAWGGWGFVCWGVCARVTAGVFGHWLIGYFAHNRGGMHHTVRGAAVQGRNIRFTSLLTMGECWHNNHHAFPGSARLGLYRGEWDPGWWCLLALQRIGLVWNLRLPADLPPREELVALPQPPQHAGLLDAWRLCFRSWRAGAASADLVVRWPARWLSRAALARLFGASVRLRRDPRRQRLTVHAGTLQASGLAAFAIAAAQRHRALAVLCAVLMPLLLLDRRGATATGV